MFLSDLFIKRPVFALVVSLLIVVGGLMALRDLPVRELPDVDPPIVSVNTSYAGASAEVIESRITEPIEQQIAGIQGFFYGCGSVLVYLHDASHGLLTYPNGFSELLARIDFFGNRRG